MATEYFRPMLDVGNPRVFNVNVLTQQMLAGDPQAVPFFRSAPLNNLVLIKDTMPDDGNRKAGPAIGTKLYFPFNEKDIYEGGRTIFTTDKHLEAALVDMFGRGALAAAGLQEDFRLLAILNRLPSLDPFLLKDVFLNEGFTIDPAYFEVGKDLWKEIELFILERFEPVVKAAFPDALTSDDKARVLIQKIWEARDLQALKPLVDAFRLPPDEALQIFSAWKGINFYSYQYTRSKPQLVQLLTWLRDLQLPPAVALAERSEMKAVLEQIKAQLRAEWQKVDKILQDYQTGYDKMFKLKVSSAGFVGFLKNSGKLYWELGNSLGKMGQGAYCWHLMSKRFPERKVPWEQLREIVALLAKIFQPDKKMTTSAAW